MDNSNDKIMVSVTIPTYNQEKYVSKALDSVLMQKVNFPIEVLVGDDASTDNTQDILRAYEKKYPSYFHMILRKKNINDQKVGNSLDLRCRSKGKYTIMLEGDDYWTDPHKLQRQVDFLESHPDFIATAHNCVVVDGSSLPNGEEYPECRDNIYTFDHYRSNIMPGQTATILYRNFYRDNSIDFSLIRKRIVPGDRCTDFTLLCNGKIYCFQEAMSAYRHVTQGGSSYSAHFKPDFDKKQQMLLALVKYSYRISNKEAENCAEFLYTKEVISGMLKRNISFSKGISYLRRIPHFAKPVRESIVALAKTRHH